MNQSKNGGCPVPTEGEEEKIRENNKKQKKRRKRKNEKEQKKKCFELKSVYPLEQMAWRDSFNVRNHMKPRTTSDLDLLEQDNNNYLLELERKAAVTKSVNTQNDIFSRFEESETPNSIVKEALHTSQRHLTESKTDFIEEEILEKSEHPKLDKTKKSARLTKAIEEMVDRFSSGSVNERGSGGGSNSNESPSDHRRISTAARFVSRVKIGLPA